MEILVSIAIILGILAVVFVPMAIYEYSTVGHTKIKISDKSIKVRSFPIVGHDGKFAGTSAHSVYMVFTEDGRTFVNRNTIFFWKFASDELQAKLKTGGTYTVKTSGLRVPILGLYKNILEIKSEVSHKKPVLRRK